MIRVKTKLEFEVEYPLNMDFYGFDIANAITTEKNTFINDPGLLLWLFADKGKTTVTIEQVNDETIK